MCVSMYGCFVVCGGGGGWMLTEVYTRLPHTYTLSQKHTMCLQAVEQLARDPDYLAVMAAENIITPLNNAKEKFPEDSVSGLLTVTCTHYIHPIIVCLQYPLCILCYMCVKDLWVSVR